MPYLSAFVIVYGKLHFFNSKQIHFNICFFIPFPSALLVLIWVITRLASDASGSRVDRASSLQERARVRHITLNRFSLFF